MKIFLANPRGFCAGVDRAIEIVERALKKHGSPVFVLHEVVHNKFVVNNLKSKGAIFVEDLNQVPNNQAVIFSAHGVSKKVRVQAHKMHKTIYDATCPLVTKVHKEVVHKQKTGTQVILIGHKGHPEVEGTLGQLDSKEITLIENTDDVDKLNITAKRLCYTTQTTLSVDDAQDIIKALKDKFANIQPPKNNDICYATQNRQDAVKNIMQKVDVLLVLGSKNSSNSNRLKEIADKSKIKAYLIDGASEIKDTWLSGVQNIGITAGASAPEVLVQEVVEYLLGKGADEAIELPGKKENVNFLAPESLRC